MTRTDIPWHYAQREIVVRGCYRVTSRSDRPENTPCWDKLDRLQGRLGSHHEGWDYAALIHEIPEPIRFEDWSAVKRRVDALGWAHDVDIERRLHREPELLRELYGIVRIVDMNAAAVAFHHGSTRQEIVAQLRDVPPTGALEGAARMIADLCAGLRGMDWVLPGPEDDAGRPRWVRAAWYMPPAARADWSRLVYSVRDVTEQHLARRALTQAKAEADAASRAKSEFLANVSHELRTPLNAIAGFSELLLEEKLGPLGHDAYREYARYIRDSGEHLLDLINDLLDLSRIEAGVGSLKLDVIDVRDVIDSGLRIVQDRARRSGLTLLTRLPEQPMMILADARKLRQVLVNLLSNAVKFTDAGGQVAVACRGEGSHSVAIEVSDTGIGMSAEQIPHAMERFGQIDHGGLHRGEGAGLGLPLAKALVELHGGTFTLDSVPGEGTIATVVLPTGEARAARARP